MKYQKRSGDQIKDIAREQLFLASYSRDEIDRFLPPDPSDGGRAFHSRESLFGAPQPSRLITQDSMVGNSRQRYINIASTDIRPQNQGITAPSTSLPMDRNNRMADNGGIAPNFGFQ